MVRSRHETKFPSAEGWHEVPGWSVTSNESRVTSNQCPPPKSGKNHNNSAHRSYECPPPPGPAQTLFAWVDSGRGVSRKARRGVGLITRSVSRRVKHESRVTKRGFRPVFYILSSYTEYVVSPSFILKLPLDKSVPMLP